MIPLTLLFEQEENLDIPKPVIVSKRMEVRQDWICPHCGEEIGEKAIFSPDEGESTVHRLCGGQIILPPSEYDDDQISNFGRSILNMLNRDNDL